MKKCFTINCMRKDEDFDGFEKIIDENIYQGVELFYPYNVNAKQRTLYTKRCLKLRNEKQIEFVLHLPHGYNNDLINENNQINDEVVKLMLSAIDYASIFNVKKCTLHLGKYYESQKRLDAINKVIEPLRIICEYAKNYNINIMIENMPGEGELGYSPDEILYLIKNTGCDNLKFIFDTGHAHCSKYQLEEYLELLKDYLYHIHFSDNHQIRDEHKRIGSGTIDFVKVFNKLKEINYDQLHCMEVIFHQYTDLIDYASDIDKFDYIYKK